MTTAAKPRIVVPATQAENPVGTGQQKPFPQGMWQGTIQETRRRAFPDFIGERAGTDPKTNGGYTSGDGEIASIQIGSNKPLEGQEDVGQRKFFVDFVTRDGEYSIEDTDLPEAAWQLQKSQLLLTNLAIALGQTEQVETPDGPAYAVAEGFSDALFDGQFNGSEVIFTVYHRNWTSKNGKSGTEEKVKGFASAV